MSEQQVLGPMLEQPFYILPATSYSRSNKLSYNRA